jgi:hypothetical protein
MLNTCVPHPKHTDRSMSKSLFWPPRYTGWCLRSGTMLISERESYRSALLRQVLP